MAGRYPPLIVWAPSRLARELRAFCLAELQQQCNVAAIASGGNAASRASAGLQALTVEPLGDGGLLARLACPAEQQAELLPHLLVAAKRCTLLTAVLQPLAAGASLEAAAAAAVEQLPPGIAASVPLRVLHCGSATARAPTERFLRQRLQQLGLGTQPAEGSPRLWCIQGPAGLSELAAEEQQEEQHRQQQHPEQQQQEQQQEQQQQQQQRQTESPAAAGAAGEGFLLALELAAGAPLSASFSASLKGLGPTAMLPELAVLSASLAAVPLDGTVLDPFCGTGSLLAAALHRGAGLAMGSDIDDSHFGQLAGSNGRGNSGSGTSGVSNASCDASPSSGGDSLDDACILMRADAAALGGMLPHAVVDAVITDLPYGYRTKVVGCTDGTAGVGCAPVSGTCSDGGLVGAAAGAAAEAAAEAATDAEDWQQLLGVLLRLAGQVLVPGGRLLAWMPCVAGAGRATPSAQQPQLMQQQERQLADAGREHGLCLLHFLPESRDSGYPRAAALFVKQGPASSADASIGMGSAPSRRSALLAAIDAAEAAGVSLHRPASLAMERAQQAAAPGEPGLQHAAAAAGSDQALGSNKNASAAGDSDAPAARVEDAVRQRGLKYKQVRGQASGKAIDVWRAAWLGDVAAVREYAAAGGDVNARDRKQQTALQFAAGYGREAVVQLLLSLGADPCTAADSSGMAPLHRAAARNHTAVLRRLLAAGADPAQRSAAGQTALMYACQFGHREAVEALLEHLGAASDEASDTVGAAEMRRPCPGGTTAVSGDGAEGGCTEGSTPAGSSGAPPSDGEVRRHLALLDAAGLSALHLAAQWGMAGVAELLLQAGADPKQASGCERQLAPAHLAARWGHAEVLHVLQRHGGDLGARCGGQGWTPLQEAEEWRRAGCVAMLRGAAGGAGPLCTHAQHDGRILHDGHSMP